MFVLVSDRAVGIYDEGCVLEGAARMLAGAVPHRDFYTNYGPGQFALVAVLFRLFEPAVWVERLCDAAARAVCVLLVFAVARRLLRAGPAAGLATIAFAWLASLTSVYGYPLFPALAAVLGAVAWLMRPPPRTLWDDARAGLCLGLASLFRFDVGVGCLLAAGAAILAENLLRHRLRAARGFALIGGFAFVMGPTMLWLGIAGAWPAIWFDVVAYPAHNYVRMRSLPFPGPSAMLSDPMALSVIVPILVCIAALPGIGLSAWRRETRDTAARACCLMLFTAVLYAKGWVRISPVHVSAGAIMALLLLAQLGAMRPRWMVVIPLPVIMAVAASGARGEVERARQNIAWLMHGAWLRTVTLPENGYDSCLLPPGLARMACTPIARDRAQAIGYVQLNVPPNEPLFVGLPRHDRILANDVAFGFEAARRPATKWYDFNPGLQTSQPIQAEMVAELALSSPPLIVIEDVFQGFREPNDSRVPSGVSLLDDYIAAHYQPDARFGRYRVLRLIR